MRRNEEEYVLSLDQDNRAVVHFHSSEAMPEVKDKSVRLMIGASVYLGPKVPWPDYVRLYEAVYLRGGERVMADVATFVLIQTDAYVSGTVLTRNANLVYRMIAGWGWEVLDVKVWRRKKADFFQPPFSLVHIMRPKGGTAKRPSGKGLGDYLQGVWDYPQTAGGPLAAYPDGLCDLLIETFTRPGDLIVDPFAGTARLLARAAHMGRRAIGYEIDKSLRPVIEESFRAPAPQAPLLR